jgi:UDP-N-acetylmuramoyl-tripeptide--D-alanyl-D-alanine ligase
MGMNNNAGEIAALTRLVRPHVALITAIAPAHIENLGSKRRSPTPRPRSSRARARRRRDHPQRHAAPRPAGQGRARHADRIITFGGGDADVHAVHAVRAEAAAAA